MRNQFVALIVMGFGGTPALQAREIKLPEPKPVLSLEVPDSWKTDTTDLGLEATSPDGDSLIIAKILVRPKDDPNAWVNQALATFEARGVIFDTKTTAIVKKATPVVAAKPVVADNPVVAYKPVVADKLAEPPPAKPPADAKPPEAKPVEADKTTTSPGAVAPPAVAPPAAAPPAAAPPAAAPTAATAKADRPSQATKPEQESKAAPAAQPATQTPEFTNSQFAPTLALNAAIQPLSPPATFARHALTYKGTSRNGKPVDVELVTFGLPDKGMFFFLQESGKTDRRILDIINSVKPTP